MVSINPPESGNCLVKTAKSLIMQPILFVQALPDVTAQVSTYGVTFLRRPVVWIALGFHGALLILPAVDLSVPKLEAVVEAEPEEEVPIEAVSLSDILAPEEPVPPPPEEPQAPPPEATPPTVVAPPVLTEVPEQLEDVIDDQDFDDEFEDDVGDEFEDNGDEQSFAFDPAQQSALNSSLSQFLGSSSEGTSNFDVTNQWLNIDPTNSVLMGFRADDITNVVDPYAFFTTDSINAGTYLPLPEATFKQISRNIELVSREGLGQALTSAGMSQVDEGLYGGHPFYGVYSADGQPVNYISLIDLKGTTLVFVWPADPRQG
ncbi:hypothetical protein [Leptothoe spongobia]|uniref:Uncharacterized protein n=1 Tax=Leptothoe spongobia TAU-MAC 1115 TaxID=1967444 RepID=A0A947DCB7_9CYAN|nr:hypothetical protein [Leptothoe spongobia]MBT9313864.1 hypothetical protein [Leptothoe spongobia TAU-MAC 1115]